MTGRTEANGFGVGLGGGVGAPAQAPERGEMAHALTFFTTANERAAVLRVLGRHGRAGKDGRTAALLAALRIDPARLKR